MRKYAIFIISAILIMSACSKSGDIVPQYVVQHDNVTAYEQPSDKSAEVFKLYHSSTRTWPILKTDDSGKWGYVEKSKDEQGWVLLGKMVYAGTTNMQEKLDAYIVTAEELKMQEEPSTSNVRVNHNAHLGDTVLATTTTKKWAHVVLYYNKESEVYGWVPLSKLKKIEPMAKQDLRDQVVAAQKRTYDEQTKAILSDKRMHWLQPTMRILSLIGVILAVLYIPIFWRRAGEREKRKDILLWIPLMAVFLASCALMVRPHWYMVFALAFFPFIVCYPLLYSQRMSKYVMIISGIISLFGLYYLFADFCLNDYSGISWWWHLFLFVIAAVLYMAVALFITTTADEDICTECGFYGNHEKLKEEVTDSTIEMTSGYEDTYSHSTTSGNVRTNWYNRKHYTDFTEKRKIRTTRLCMNCRRRYYNHREETKNLGRRYH